MERIFTETVTHAYTRDIELPHDLGVLALITLDNGDDHKKPTTLGPQSLHNIQHALHNLRKRAFAGEIAAIGITGKAHVLAAGADLKAATTIATRQDAHDLGKIGHDTFRILGELPIPTFCFINGVALGGGLEIALNCTYRTVSSDVQALALPETSLGLVPGWGGTYLLPRLVGLETALDVMLTRPARNKPYKAPEAVAIGLADVLFDSADFLKESIQWAAHVISGEVVVSRPSPTAPERWDAVLSAARQQLSMTTTDTLPAPHTLLNLLALGPQATRDEGFAAEDDALEHLIMSDEFRASIYAFNAINAAKHPKNVPNSQAQRTIQRVGIVGAGLMAAQLALLFSQRLDIPVIMRDIDQHRVDKGLAHIAAALEKLTQEGRLTEPEAAKIRAGIHGTTHIEDFSQCDFIIEAVTENLPLKKAVFAELEGMVSAKTILATNTSALSITAMSADLKHPERVVGIHFFNPVARMPLVEVIRTPHTSEETLATAFALTQTLKKTAVIAADRPGFIVNRLLILLMGKVVETIEQGTSVTVADQALRPLGLPMGPFALFDLVGPAVGLHVLTTLRDELGTRFPHSPGLERIVADQKAVSHKPHGTHLPAVVDPSIAQYFGTDTPPDQRKERSAAEVLDHVLSALTTEIGLMLDEGAVADPTDIDVSMILGAGWSFAAGGITPYLDRTGYSERILGKRFHPAGVASVPIASTTQ